MRTLILFLCAVLLPAGLSFGQPVYDVAVETQLKTANTNLTTIDGKLKTISDDIKSQLELAEKDNESLDDIKEGVQDTVERLDSLLERIGDPASVDMNGNKVAKGRFGDVQDAVANAMEDGIVKDRPEPDTGDTSIFNGTYDGLLEKELGTSYQYQPESGGEKKTVNRDPKKYVGESEQIKAVEEYYRVRDKAVERREALLEVLADVLENMKDNSKDFAHLAKQTALVEVIQGQLQVCSNDINNAYNDAAMKGFQVYALNSAKSKSDAEPLMKEMKDKSDALEASLDGILASPGMPAKPAGAAPSMSGFLPWPTR